MKTRLLIALAIIAWVFFSAATTALAQDFYAGKTIRFIVGYGPGGGYDTYTRAIARHMGKHIPGKPATVVENMDGAGSLLAANFLYARAEPDGLTLGDWNSGMVLLQALGGKAIKFDAQKFGWIGAPGAGLPVCGIMGFAGPKTWQEVASSKKEIKFGGSAPGANTNDIPDLMNKLQGTNFKVISGYKGSADIRLAMQRKEVDAVCLTWESMRVTARAMLDAKGDDRLTPFIFHGKSNDPEVRNLPQFTQVIKGADNIAAFKAYANPLEFQRPIMAPPNLPKDRLNTLRRAFDETMKDPEFLADTQKSKLLIEPVRGEEIDKLVGEVLSISSAAKEKLRFLAEPGK